MDSSTICTGSAVWGEANGTPPARLSRSRTSSAWTASLRTAADSISNLRDSVDGSTDLDQGISPTTQSGNLVSNIVPLDSNGLAFSRTPAQTLNVVYLNGASVSSGGFFPAGVNGTIKTSAASA